MRPPTHQASLADERGGLVLSGHRFGTTAADLERLWSRLPAGHRPEDLTVVVEPTRNAWVAGGLVPPQGRPGRLGLGGAVGRGTKGPLCCWRADDHSPASASRKDASKLPQPEAAFDKLSWRLRRAIRRVSPFRKRYDFTGYKSTTERGPPCRRSNYPATRVIRSPGRGTRTYSVKALVRNRSCLLLSRRFAVVLPVSCQPLAS